MVQNKSPKPCYFLPVGFCLSVWQLYLQADLA